MLRWLVVLMLLANLGFWAWSQGHLAGLAGGLLPPPDAGREPGRLQQQVSPERIELSPR